MGEACGNCAVVLRHQHFVQYVLKIKASSMSGSVVEATPVAAIHHFRQLQQHDK